MKKISTAQRKMDIANIFTSENIEQSISRLEHRIKERFNQIKQVFIEVQSRRGHQMKYPLGKNSGGQYTTGVGVN